MALSTIDDILADFPGWTTEFKLVSYDETSKTQGGDTLVKARGTPLWNLTATSRTLKPNELDYWRARLESLDEGKRPFWGYSLSRRYPIAYPNGTFGGDLLTSASFSRTSTATYFDASGVLQTAAANVLRDAYDPISHAYLGKMVEGTAATNLLEYDEEFDNTAWFKTGCSVTANAATGVDGTATMDKLVEDTSTGTHFITAAVASPIVGGTQCAAAIDFKKGERTHAAVALMNNSGSPYENATVFIDLNTGVATMTPSGVTNANFGVQQLPNGIWRVWVTCLLGSTVTLPSLVVWTSDGTSTSYTGDGSSGIYVDRAQLEVGTMPTSFIKTTNAVATRSADTLSIPATMLQWDEDALTVEFVGQALPGWSFIDFGQFDKGSLNQPGAFRFHVQSDRAMFYVENPDGTDALVSAFATIDLTQPVTAKFSWNGTTIGVCVNGGPVQTYTMSVPASDFGFTRFILGNGSWFSQAGAIIKSVTMTPEPVIEQTATIASLGSNNKSLSLSGLPSGFSLAVGDMLSFEYTGQPRYALHRVQEAAIAGSDGTTGMFEVRPFIQAGAAVGDAVRIKQPRCLMMLVPGSITSTAQLQNGMGTVSFQGVQIPREF